MAKDKHLSHKEIESRLRHYRKLDIEREKELREARKETEESTQRLHELKYGISGRKKFLFLILLLIFLTYIYFTYIKK